jgi:hypothetical protein
MNRTEIAATCLALLWLMLYGVAAMADETFDDSIAPLLERRCLGCHNDQQRQGEFSLQSAPTAFADGYITAGDADGSHLIELVTPQAGQSLMPKDADPLSSDEIQLLRDWIDNGAHWPQDQTLQPARAGDFDWWSFRPLRRPPVPLLDELPSDVPATGIAWARTPIDCFVYQRLREHGLAPAPAADRRTLIRRLTYDLTGLPPSPEEVSAFVADGDPMAYEKLVDRLLDSDHYGERWARHWLDVVKYADTCGYDKDKLRPHAWPYRDYVIRSFNQDKPYARFVQEQIAGDVLFPGEADGILGLGFIAAGPWDFIGHVEVAESKVDGKVARNLDRDDMVSNTINTFCSVTIQCARCHHHKFDPFTQQHYYGLQSIFAAVDRADRPFDSDPQSLVYAAATKFEANGTFCPTEGTPRPIHVLLRGDVQSLGEPMGPGVLPLQEHESWQLAEDLSESQRRAELARWLTNRDHPLVWRSIVNRVWQYHFGTGIVATPNDFGRMGAEPTHPELLDWLACEFRDGGTSLQAQSFKSLHRLMVTSSVYQQASTADHSGAAIDGSNRWLWRMNRRRLTAEEIRDSILSVSGALDRTMGGPGYYLFALEHPEHSPHFEYHKFDPADPTSHRRAIYRFIVRSQPNPWMTTLDCADSSQSTPQRSETLTALQALTLLNSPFNLTMTKRFAQRLQQQATTLEEQVELAMQLIAQRNPDSVEFAELTQFAGQHGLDQLCRYLFNLSEFVYLD